MFIYAYAYIFTQIQCILKVYVGKTIKNKTTQYKYSLPFWKFRNQKIKINQEHTVNRSSKANPDGLIPHVLFQKAQALKAKHKPVCFILLSSCLILRVSALCV